LGNALIEPVIVFSRDLAIAAVGHYAPYINYRLKVIDSQANLSRATKTAGNEAAPSAFAERVLRLKEQIQNTSKKHRPTTNDLTYTFTRCQLLPTANCVHSSPIFNVAVDTQIIPDHGTIDRWYSSDS